MEIDVNPKASEWILKQPWLSQFVNNCIARGDSPQDILCFLLGQDSSCTIYNAFIWEDTPEGQTFWGKIDNEMSKVGEDENWEGFYTTIEI